MATYYVWSGAAGTNAGTSWTNAYTAFGSAVTAATAAGDVILVHYTHQEPTLAVDTTYGFGANVSVISVNKDSSDTPTVMDTGGWIGDSVNNRGITLSGAFRVFFSGVTFRTSGSTADEIRIDGSDGSHFEFEGVYFWNGNTSASSYIRMGQDASNQYFRFTNCKFRFGNTSQIIAVRGARIEFEGCSIVSAGSAPSILFDDVFGGNNTAGSCPDVVLTGCDLSHVTGTLVGSMNNQARTFRFVQCKLGVNVTTVTSVLASQTPANKSSGAVYLFDCNSGDTHGIFGYYDGLGSCVSDTGIYYTTGAAVQSWKIVTGPNCSFGTPFTTPFVDLYHTGTSAIRPRLEILRDASTTAFKNDEVWGEFFVKKDSGSTQSTEYSDRRAVLPTTNADQDAGAGLSAWTGWTGAPVGGGNDSAWSGKVDTGTDVTPAENGHIRARVCVAAASTTLYVDPQIRT